MVKENANAKINLFLDVVSRREDGFHNIKSIMQSVSLCDTLFVSASRADKTEILINADSVDLPTDKNNLIFASAAKYLEYFGINAEVEIKLEKRIPIGAGLGGGSADAAATLRAMNKIFGLATKGELLSLATQIGSDVPFCLVGGTALCEGRGEIITPIAFGGELHLVIAIGKDRVSTPHAYRALDELCNFEFTPDQRGDLLAGEMSRGEISFGNLYNIFERVTDLPEISKIKEILTKSGAECSLMSGSGPSIFGVFADRQSAENAKNRLVFEGFTAFYANGVTV